MRPWLDVAWAFAKLALMIVFAPLILLFGFENSQPPHRP